MYKPRWGAFFDTSLMEFLQKREIQSLVITGCNFPNCPRTTMYEASERDFRLAIVEEGLSGLYERGLQELEAIGVHVLGFEETLDIFEFGLL